MYRNSIIFSLAAACFLFLAHAVLPHEHEGGHVAEIITSHSHHNVNTTDHHHSHNNDCDHKSDNFCLLENVIPSRIVSLPDIINLISKAHTDVTVHFLFLSVSNYNIEPPEKIPDKQGNSKYFVKSSNPNFMSSGLRAPPIYS